VPSLAEAGAARGGDEQGEMKPNPFLLSAFLLFALVNCSCAQPKQKVEPVNVAPPQLIWQYDTGG
jgi:hypothetical protein